MNDYLINRLHINFPAVNGISYHDLIEFDMDVNQTQEYNNLDTWH